MESLMTLKQCIGERAHDRNMEDNQLRVQCLTRAGEEHRGESALPKMMTYLRLYNEKFSPFVDKDLFFAGTPGYFWLPGDIAGLIYDIGHFCADYQRLIDGGVEGIREEVMRSTPHTEAEAEVKQAYLETTELFIEYMRRHAEEAERMAATCEKIDTKENLLRMVRDIRHICVRKPVTFRQGLQLLLFAHSYIFLKPYTGTITFGNLDRTLEKLYLAEKNAGTLTYDEALENICQFYLSLCTMHRNTQNIVLGGSDSDGGLFENDLTVLFMEAQAKLHLEQPSVSLKIRPDTSDRVWDAALSLLSKGGGMPSFLNDAGYINSLVKNGFTQEDSNTFCNIGCYEATPYGNTFGGTTSGNMTLVDVFHRFFMEEKEYATFEDLLEAWESYAQRYYVTDLLPGFVDYRRSMEVNSASPFLGLILDGCIDSLKLPEQYGAKNNIFSVLFGGLGSLVDSLLCIKHFVYDDGVWTLAQLRKEVVENYPDKEVLALLRAYPERFGSDDEFSNRLAAREAKFLADMAVDHPFDERVKMIPALFIFTGDIYTEGLPSTPDGRQTGDRYSYGASASELLPRRDITKVLMSTASLPLERFPIGAPTTVHLTADFLNTAKGREGIRKMVEAYHLEGGTHIQIDIANPDVLRDAQKNPDQYKDLLIRISGHTEPFTRLNRVMQDALIARAEMGC